MRRQDAHHDAIKEGRMPTETLAKIKEDMTRFLNAPRPVADRDPREIPQIELGKDGIIRLKESTGTPTAAKVSTSSRPAADSDAPEIPQIVLGEDGIIRLKNSTDIPPAAKVSISSRRGYYGQLS